jgi:hypothetical protein
MGKKTSGGLYISSTDYNNIVDEISTAKSSRGLSDTTAAKVSNGSEITQKHITNLQNAVDNTIRYGANTRFPFSNPSINGSPLALLYNQVRQVVTDLEMNQRCISCANKCRENCDYNCYSNCSANCGSGCGTGCGNGCTGCTNSCTGCTNACTGGCGSGTT